MPLHGEYAPSTADWARKQAERFEASVGIAREVEGAEREEWWARAVETWPDYASYARRTKRLIPVFVLEPSDD